MEKLTQKQAFVAMIEFLDNYYQQTQSDDIGALLGSLQLLEDGKPADPAMWHDWVQCVEKKPNALGGCFPQTPCWGRYDLPKPLP